MTLARYPYERAIPLAGQRETPEARKSQHPLNQDNMEFIKIPQSRNRPNAYCSIVQSKLEVLSLRCFFNGKIGRTILSSEASAVCLEGCF